MSQQTFHKNIALFEGSKGENSARQVSAGKKLAAAAPTTLQTQPSESIGLSGGKKPFSASINGGKLANMSVSGSFFSRSTLQNSMFASFRTTTGGGSSVPRVSIQNIIKKKAEMYYDEAMSQNFDELLDNGYTVVQSKKQEREQLKKQEETFMLEIGAVEKEIIPLISKMMAGKEHVANQKEVKDKYEADIAVLNSEIADLTKSIQKRGEETRNLEKDYLNKIRRIETENNAIRNEIAQNKAQHKSDKENQVFTLKAKHEELNQMVIKLNKMKAKHDARKMEVSEKLRKMENKSKMFIGILKH